MDFFLYDYLHFLSARIWSLVNNKLCVYNRDIAYLNEHIITHICEDNVIFMN